MVLVAMRVAAKPATWNWLFVGRQTPSESQTGKDAKTGALQLKAGEFRAAVKTPAGGTHPPQKKTSGRNAGRLDLGAAILTGVRDRESLKFDELPARNAALSRVAKIPADELEREAKTDIAHTVLMSDPDRYRGSVVTIAGRLGSLRKLPDPHKALGALYEGWIVTRDSGSDPYRVVLSELPDGLQPNDGYEPPPQVRATGYFFKIERYRVNDERYHNAPLILARTIQVTPTKSLPRYSTGLAPYVVGFALALGGILAFTIWRLSRGDKQFAETHLGRFDSTRTGEPHDLNDLEAGEDAGEFFRKLEKNEEPPGESRR